MSFFERFANALLVAGLAPDHGMDDLLVEQAPDEEIAQPRVGELLEPACAGAFHRIVGKQRMPGISFVQIGADHR